MPDRPPIREGQLLLGPLFSEPMQVETVRNAIDDDSVFDGVGEILLAPHVEPVLRDYCASELGNALQRGEEGAKGLLAQAEDHRDCRWLYIVTNCKAEPKLEPPVKDPARFPWQEITKVEHYRLNVDQLAS